MRFNDLTIYKCEDTQMLIFRLLIHIKRVKTIVKLLIFITDIDYLSGM